MFDQEQLQLASSWQNLAKFRALHTKEGALYDNEQQVRLHLLLCFCLSSGCCTYTAGKATSRVARE